MTVIGLDLSLTCTGFAVLDKKNPQYGTIMSQNMGHDFNARRTRYEMIWEELFRCIDTDLYNANIVVVEGYSMGSRGRGFTGLVELGWYIRNEIASRGVREIIEIPPSRLKAFITGSGNAKKQGMVNKVNEIFHTDIEDHNEADALGLAYLGKHLMGYGDPTGKQKGIVEEIWESDQWLRVFGESSEDYGEP